MSKTKIKKKEECFRDYLNPEFLIVCNDVIVGVDQTVTFVRLIDQAFALVFPLQLGRLVFVTQFSRNEKYSWNEFSEARLVHKLVVIEPGGNATELGSFVPAVDPSAPWKTTRAILDLSNKFTFTEEGTYVFRLLGKTRNSEFEQLIEKKFPVQLSTGVAGLYMAEFSTIFEGESRSANGMVLLLPDGTLQGFDAEFQYQGNYLVDPESRVKASLTLVGREGEVDSIYGKIREVQLDIDGKIESGSISAIAHPKVEGGPPIEIKLIRQNQFS